ncbi:MAG: cytochrome b/b6 domain-containing protein, partial [Rubritepida sp.]|nr:cytochrome b/b6 domain-containing protein [Rubritepida sp.]
MASALHWLIALLILALLATGFAAANAEGAAKAALLRPHLPLGLAVLALTLLRLAWTLIERRRGARPGPLPDTPAWQRFLARAAHALLYVVPLGMAASGIGLMALSGAAPAIFGGGALPDFWRFAPRIPHGIGARLL